MSSGLADYQLIGQYMQAWESSAPESVRYTDGSLDIRRKALRCLELQPSDRPRALPPAIGAVVQCSESKCPVWTVSRCDACLQPVCPDRLFRQNHVFQSDSYAWFCFRCCKRDE